MKSVKYGWTRVNRIGKRNIRNGSIETLLKKYLKENIFKVLWTAVLSFGGITLFTYFVSIQFLPSLDLSTATTVLASVALIGVFFIFIIGGTVVAPAYLILTVFNDQLSKEEGNLVISISFLASIPMLLLIFTFLNDFENAEMLVPSFLGTIFLLFLISTDVVQRREEGLGVSYKYIGNKDYYWKFLILIIVWPGAVFIQILPFVWIFTDGNYQIENFDFGLWVLISVCISLMGVKILSKQAIPIVPGCGKLANHIFFIIVFILTLLIISRNLLFFSKLSVSALSLGNIDNVRVVLKREGCEVLKNATDGYCDFSCNDGYVLYPATILSRMGKEYLIDIGSAAPDSFNYRNNIKRRVVFKDDQVMGWSRNYVNVVNGKH